MGSAPGKTVLAVDGAENPYANVGAFIKGTRVNPDQFFLISPDGKYVAFVGQRADNKVKSGLWINDKQVLDEGRITRPFFTPDSQHLTWVTAPNDRALYVDGEAVLHFESSALDDLPEAFEMGSDGVLQFLAPAGDVIKRYRVTPRSDASVDAMLAKAGK
jgi:WD40 repeat protein